MQPLVDLTNSLNWNIAYRAAHNATVNSYGGIVAAIPPVYFQFSSHALVVSIANGNARPHWILGGFVSVEAPAINTGSTATIPGNVEIASKRIKLSCPSLVRIPQIGIPPYVAKISIPRWFTTVLVEAWWYDENSADPVVESLDRIEGKLNTLIP